jgi:hypothetical protein
MSKMGSHHPFGHRKHKLWANERLGVKLAVWLPTTKSWELTQFRHVRVICNIPLKISWWGLQLCFRLHCNRRFAHEVMRPKVTGVLAVGISGLPLGSFRTKNHLDVALMKRHRIYYKGEGGGFPQVRAVVSLMSLSYPWFVLTPKVLQLCNNQFVTTLLWKSERMTP